MSDKHMDIEAREAIIEVSKTNFGREVTNTERIAIRPFQTHPATVSIKAGATVNLGNYESGRIDVMLSVPCYLEEIDEIYEKVKDWVDDRVAKEYNELKKEAG